MRLIKILRNGARKTIICALLAAALFLCNQVLANVVTFELMTWTNDWVNEVTNLPSAVGLKPSYNNTNDDPYTTLESDWLVFTSDDKYRGGYNAVGALSHKFNDRVGLSGVEHGGYESANSLTGFITMAFTESNPDVWEIDVKDFYTAGWKTDTPSFSKSYLVTTNMLVVVTNAEYRLDGLDNTGVWHSSSAANWELSFRVDSVADTPKVGFVNHTEEYNQCFGCIIPIDQLTSGGMAATTINDGSGYYTNDFEQYLLDEIAPRLPDDALYLFVAQLLKTHLLYSSVPDHVDTNKTLFGECWIAYTNEEIVPEPAMLYLPCIAAVFVTLVKRYRR